MSLISCPECGKEISNQAEYCICCGYPVQKMKNSIQKASKNDSYTVILNSAGYNRPLNIKCVRAIKGAGIAEAMQVIDNTPSIVSSNISFEKAESLKQMLEQVGAIVIIKESDENDELKYKPKDNVIHCPRCGSASITTGQRGFSFWTGFLGSNKTVNRCAKCGYSWQP